MPVCCHSFLEKYCLLADKDVEMKEGGCPFRGKSSTMENEECSFSGEGMKGDDGACLLSGRVLEENCSLVDKDFEMEEDGWPFRGKCFEAEGEYFLLSAWNWLGKEDCLSTDKGLEAVEDCCPLRKQCLEIEDT